MSGFCLLFVVEILRSVLCGLSIPSKILMLTVGYNGLCNLIQGNKVCVCNQFPSSLAHKSLGHAMSCTKGPKIHSHSFTPFC